ncbi:putative Cobyrinic acid a [Paratrimastix pyriformis]|uniref:Queuosine 5'-phosphate N-glycosylase/hydrolase n=1 Tax=Paratrimastix pyriformis TaxID=342808 RepID=A0ABQ8U8V3_9EUKA|nr:putative Cobyrinic acid a [Paratrimastix pyriformis]
MLSREAILESCQRVAGCGAHVSISDEGLERFVGQLETDWPKFAKQVSVDDTPVIVPEPWKDTKFQERLIFSDERTEVNWIVAHCLIEIGHGWRHQLQAHHNRGASQTITLGMFTSHQAGFTYTARHMADLTLEQVAGWFNLPLRVEATGAAHPLAVFAEQLHRCLVGAGQGLLAAGMADFFDVVDAVTPAAPAPPPVGADASAATCPSAWPLISRLVGLCPAFNDREMYTDPKTHQAAPVLFMKKVQLAMAELYRRLDGWVLDMKKVQLAMAQLYRRFRRSDPGRFAFRDIDSLTVFVDNVLPCMLRVNGVLRVSPALTARIEARQPLDPGSPEEMELRACALVACSRLVARLRERGVVSPTEADLDYYLWLMGKWDQYRDVERHYTPGTIYY